MNIYIINLYIYIIMNPYIYNIIHTFILSPPRSTPPR